MTELGGSIKDHPLILEYASVEGELYDMISATNPTLKTFIDMAKELVNVEK